MAKPYTPLTVKFTGLVDRLMTTGGVSLPYNPHEKRIEDLDFDVEWGEALWDTGATQSVITEKVAEKLGLQPTGKRDIRTGSGPEVWNVYLVNIHLNNDIILFNAPVAACPDDESGFDLIVGMDILKRGDFAITNRDGITTMSFRSPSIETIDYEEELRQLQTPTRSKGRLSRNAPCECGSGKKRKHCQCKA